MICSNYPRVTLSKNRSIALLRDRIHMECESKNRLAVIGKTIIKLESSKSDRTKYQFVNSWENTFITVNAFIIFIDAESIWHYYIVKLFMLLFWSLLQPIQRLYEPPNFVFLTRTTKPSCCFMYISSSKYPFRKAV